MFEDHDSLERRLDTYLGKRPSIGPGVYIAEGARVMGDVTLGEQSSVWYNAVLRGDINRIVVGRGTNIQDNSVLHLSNDLPCLVGEYVTVGHAAVVHACTIGNEVLVGMGAVVLDGAEVGEQSLIGARALVPQGMKIPAGSLVIGMPARVVRALTPEERANPRRLAEKYMQVAAYNLARRINLSPLLMPA